MYILLDSRCVIHTTTIMCNLEQIDESTVSLPLKLNVSNLLTTTAFIVHNHIQPITYPIIHTQIDYSIGVLLHCVHQLMMYVFDTILFSGNMVLVIDTVYLNCDTDIVVMFINDWLYHCKYHRTYHCPHYAICMYYIGMMLVWGATHS